MPLTVYFLFAPYIAIPAYCIGHFWFKHLFAGDWTRAMHVELDQTPTTRELIHSFFLILFSTILLNLSFANPSPSMASLSTLYHFGAFGRLNFSPILLWLCFYCPVDFAYSALKQRSRKLFLINTGYRFCMVVVASIITGPFMSWQY